MNLFKFILVRFYFVFLLVVVTSPIVAQNFLSARGKYIIDERGRPVILKGVGLGGYMLKEGYMMKVPFEGQQYVFEQNVEALVGKSKAQNFYKSWLQNHLTKVDIDSLKSWGFNSVRLPMHYKLFTLPVEKEPIKGLDTWLDTGFELTDSLLKWCKANEMYLILDMHSTPGGQGHDLPISDRDPQSPSLWQSEANQNKLMNLWAKIALKYRDEIYIGGYDLINEPNWGFQDSTDKSGGKEKLNEPLRNLLIKITKAIRAVDRNHLIIIEGNGWGNNYQGVLPPWDNNMAVSFHKYWTINSQESIKTFLDIREKYNIPLWLGEAGENSNTWFNEAISLSQANDIGWCWWPLKKIGFNNPLEIKMNEGYQAIINYWAGKGPRPDTTSAYNSLMELALNTNAKNCIYHKDVIDAMFRQTKDSTTTPFSQHQLPGVINAVNYDMGKANEAYSDRVVSNLHITNATGRVTWNDGRIYRNDGVDIAKDLKGSKEDLIVTNFETGEWLAYSLNVPAAHTYNLQLKVRKNDLKDNALIEIAIGNSIKHQIQVGLLEDWKLSDVVTLKLTQGVNKLKIKVLKGNIQFKGFELNQ
ncbi:MAG: cellulase family glycosylhydrolase [Flavobacterium sp.]|nr:cellulase family glycosylhydrolase [Pedobacter sp.]